MCAIEHLPFSPILQHVHRYIIYAVVVTLVLPPKRVYRLWYMVAKNLPDTHPPTDSRQLNSPGLTCFAPACSYPAAAL